MLNELKQTLMNENNNVAITENGAVMYETTGKNILDLMWKVPSFRSIGKGKISSEIENQLTRSYYENKEVFAKFLFYLRDVRGGMGERNTFRNFYLWYAGQDKPNALNLMKWLPEYGRWDDLVWMVSHAEDKDVKECCAKLLVVQFGNDINSENPSLLGKWLPSVNAGKESKKEAKRLLKVFSSVGFDIKESEYRKCLAKLRKKIDIVETHIAEKDYSTIDYERVPSVANVYYKDMFLKYDGYRREKYLESLASGNAKINASAVFPHDIYRKVLYRSYAVEDQTLEQMWKNLPDFVNGKDGVLVVRDGSDSMLTKLPNSNVTALDVASALCIYFAERLSGEFKNKFITFSSRPQLVELDNCTTLMAKKKLLNCYDDCSNTDIEATFDLILETAVSHNMKQEDLPSAVLIVSDMEFDGATTMWSWNISSRELELKYVNLFKVIEAKFAGKGYKMPKLVFWNVCSRTNAIPVTQNEYGVVLVSGFSVNICKMVLTNKLDPYKALLEQLYSPRYENIKLLE